MAKKKTIPQMLNEIEAKLDQVIQKDVSWYKKAQEEALEQWKKDIERMAAYYKGVAWIPEKVFVPKEIGFTASGALLFNNKRQYLEPNEVIFKDRWNVMAYGSPMSYNGGERFQILSEDEEASIGDLVYFGVDRYSESSRKDIYNYGFYLGDGKVVHVAGKTVEWDFEPKNFICKVERV